MNRKDPGDQKERNSCKYLKDWIRKKDRSRNKTRAKRQSTEILKSW